MSRLTTKAQLTNKELRQLDDFLKKHELTGIAFVHGFLTAIVSSPGVIMPSEWIGALGLNNAEFESTQEFEQILDSLMTMRNGICHDLLAKNFQVPDSFNTLDNMTPYELKKIWVAGYAFALECDQESRINENTAKMLFSMMLINFTDEMLQGFVEEKISAEQADELRAKSAHMLSDLANAIYLYWRTEHDIDHHHAEAPVHEKVGRNAPCPCGSGKKYKQCCLTANESLHH